mgnify:CR=1 FL=1
MEVDTASRRFKFTRQSSSGARRFSASRMALVALLSRITEESSEEIDESVSAVQRTLESERGGEARPLGDRDRTVLELALRTQLDTLLKRSKLRGHSIEAVGVPRLLDVAIALAHAEVSDPNTPFALLEDLFDANVVSAAEAAFALVEARAAALAQLLSADQKHAKGKLTILLTGPLTGPARGKRLSPHVRIPVITRSFACSRAPHATQRAELFAPRSCTHAAQLTPCCFSGSAHPACALNVGSRPHAVPTPKPCRVRHRAGPKYPHAHAHAPA